MAQKIIKVVELFAGVGGFRIGLDKASNKDVKYKTIWNSQWEPGCKRQYASNIYQRSFGSEGHSCEDIEKVVNDKFHEIPTHDILVGGFPCQDYSVAKARNQAEGLKGKKGVLWWSIYNILKKSKKDAPDFFILENVDRLLKSPASQRGRDFAIMLASLVELGYAVEWRVINAADYGFPQRRRRIFIVGYKKGTKPYQEIKKCNNYNDWLQKEGVIAKGFSVHENNNSLNEVILDKDLVKISDDFSKDKPKQSPFENAGVMINGKAFTKKVESKYKGKYRCLGEVLLDDKDVPEEFFINEKDMDKWKYLKGAKREKRKTKDGFEYEYSEGAMIFPDALDRSSRTIVTGEGGISPSRFKHVIEPVPGRFRRLTPIELERLNMFPDGHTVGVPDTKRAFIMGNALVVGVITKLGKALSCMI